MSASIRIASVQILQMAKEGAEEDERLESDEAASQFEVVDEDIMTEQVVQALGGLKRKVAPDRDGLTMEMFSCDILVDFWWCIFNWYWKFGMIPFEWRSVVVPIPKKQKGGPCREGEYRGISLVAVPYKAFVV